MAMKKTTLMTEGNIWKQILFFSIPLILGNLLQQLYNTADSIIVGNFVGSEALAAVGSSGSLINLLISFCMGASAGAGVVIAQYYGANDKKRVQDAVHTTLAIAVVTGAILSIVGIVASPLLLQWMGTPKEVMPNSVLYLRIFFGGLVFNVIYNMAAGILNAVGNSKRSLIYLAIASVSNIVLDLVFVMGLHMGVAGAALATILLQALSAVLVLWVLMRTKDMHRLELRKIRFDGRMFHRIIRIGLPAGLQSVMYTSSNILIQSSVNALGTDTVAAWTAYSKIDSLFWMIVNAFGISITTFVGQNYGAGKMDRVHKGVRTCMGITAGATVLLSVILYNYASICYQLFTTDAQVVVIGEQILHFLVPTYFTYIAIEILSGTLRGIGDSWLPMIICCLGICALRVVWILTAVPLKNDILTIVFSYPLTWTVTSIAFIVYYLFFSRLKIVERKR